MSYDAFISHNHADKQWVRSVHDSLTRHDYNGRSPRVWIDEQVLDPGLPSSDRELYAALDLSRVLIVVLSPDSIASTWVRKEIDYFLSINHASDVVVVLRRSCEIPTELTTSTLIDWQFDGDGVDENGDPCAQLIDAVFPSSDADIWSHRQDVRRAWKASLYSQPSGFDPTPTEANTELLELLLSSNIADSASEGLALVGFERVGNLLSDIDGAAHYNTKMVFGEFLAIAILNDHRYRQVTVRLVEQELRTSIQPTFNQFRNRALHPNLHVGPGTNLAFAVARAESKLAEIDPQLIDLSTLWSILVRLDQRNELAGDERAVAVLVGRTLGKLRNSDVADTLIHTLVRYGQAASHLAAATSISTNFDNDPGTQFTTEFADLLSTRKTKWKVDPPSASIARLLLAGQLMELPSADIIRCHDDFVRNWGSDWPAGTGLWPRLGHGPPARYVWNGPLVGTVRLVTLANMESIADTLGPGDIACLTEPRIVDLLLIRAGGFIIEEQEHETPLCQRLIGRSSRFAMVTRTALDSLEEGTSITIPRPVDGQPFLGFMVAPTS